MFYSFQEKKLECGKLLADELKNDNSCMLITEGTCNVYKHKNIVQPFRVWRESLDNLTKAKHGSNMDSYQGNILAMTSEVIKVATIGPGELIGAETLLVSNPLDQIVSTFSSKQNSKDSKPDQMRPEGLSLFTVEVSSPSLEYLLISKVSFRKYLKGGIRSNLISRFFYNLEHRNKLITTKILNDPNSRPADFSFRCGGQGSKLEAVRLQMYQANEKLVKSLKEVEQNRGSPNNRSKWISMHRRLKEVEKIIIPEKITPVDEKIYKELNELRRNKKIVFDIFRPQQKVKTGYSRVRATSLGSITEQRDQFRDNVYTNELSAQRSLNMAVRHTSPDLSAERPISCLHIMTLTGSMTKKSDQTVRSINLTPGSPLIIPVRSLSPQKKMESRALLTADQPSKIPPQEPSRLLDSFFRKLTSNSLKTDINLNDIRLDQTMNKKDSLLDTRANFETDRSVDTSIKFKTNRSRSRTETTYCHRERERLSASRSVRKQREAFHIEQSAFNQRQSAKSARRAINLLQRNKRSGKDISVLFTQPVVHLSAVYT